MLLPRSSSNDEGISCVNTNVSELLVNEGIRWLQVLPYSFIQYYLEKHVLLECQSVGIEFIGERIRNGK